jgi:NAD(P)H-dependent FMN reductase
MSSVLLVFAHHRRDSLTGQVADRLVRALAANGNSVEFADRVAEGFDSVLRDDDEPDWDNPDKVYSPAVMGEIERIRRNVATIMVFPVYGWSVAAFAEMMENALQMQRMEQKNEDCQLSVTSRESGASASGAGRAA